MKGGCVWRLVRMLINLPPEYFWPESLFCLRLSLNIIVEVNQKERGCEDIYLAVYEKEALTCCLDNTDTCFSLIDFKISRGIPPCLFFE